MAALLFSLISPAGAQQKPEPAPPPFNPAIYRIGERLTYDVSFAHFVSAAHVELLVAGRGRYFNRDGIELRAHVETTGVINVALLALNNDYTTYIDAVSGLPYRSQQVARQPGKSSEATSSNNHPAGTEAIPPRSLGGETGAFDLLSAVYRLRAVPMIEGTSFLISAVSDSQEFPAEMRIAGRAMIKTGVGSFNTIVGKIKAKGAPLSDIRVYFSEDEWHVPVLITAKHREGEIRAELAASELIQPTSPPTGPTIQPVRPLPTDGRTPPVVPGDNTGPNASNLNLPFSVGEQLNYQVYLGDGSKSMGTLTLGVTSRGKYFNRNGLMFTVTAQTNSDGGRLFYVNDKIVSYVDPETLLPFRTEINLAEGKWRTTRAYNVDQDRGAVITDKKARIEVPVGTHDLLSLIYALRTFDLSPLKRNAISILAINQPRTLFITSQRRETIELGGQKIPALLLTLTTDDAQADRLQLRLWVGDDSRHLPLRISAVTPLGSVRADLAIVPGAAR
ncbi:MAG TPA: DUF3108 domain-containing protein [Pyrinomonadaceae bacterium]|nr:DUF3108 domain-containing protein [Pyrinomonadaceae bacterium]